MSPEGYDVATKGVAWTERADRRLITLRGRDRASWLHNLVTNEIRDLEPGQGIYTFATNVKGRIIFDANVLVRDDAIWLELDGAACDVAVRHLDRYLLREDVAIQDETPSFGRIAFLGPRTAAFAERIGLNRFEDMGPLAHVTAAISGAKVTALRHDFAGLPGLELFWPKGEAAGSLEASVIASGSPLGLTRVPAEIVEVLRIEAGIPWWGKELDDTVLPAETGQFARAVSIQKGCYLGQEVVERMRSRGALARQLVGLRFDESDPPALPARVVDGGKEVGVVTSACVSPAAGSVIGLAYVRTSHARSEAVVTVEFNGRQMRAVIADLPFRPA